MNKTTWKAVGISQYSSQTNTESKVFGCDFQTENEDLYREILFLLQKQRKKEDESLKGEKSYAEN